MFKILVKKEMLNNLLNYRFILAYFVITLLMVSSFGVTFGDYLGRKADYEINAGLFRDRALASRDLYSGVLNLRVARPVPMMSVFAVGGEKEPDAGTCLFAPKPSWFKGELSRNPIRAFFPSMDLVFVIGVIVSLLVFVLCYDAIAGEREAGTLKVLLASPVPRDQVFLAKWAGGLLSVAIPCVTSLLIIALILFLNASTSLDWRAWVRLGAIAATCLLYLATVYSLGMMVSALCRDSATVALLLLAVWALVVVAIPTASPSFAYSLIKPENPEMNLLRARVSVDHPRPQMDSLNRATIRGEFAKHGIDLANQRSIVWTEEKMRAARSITALNDPLYYQVQCRDLNTVFDQLTKQELRVDWLSTWFARLSPYGCLQNGCTSFAGTGFSHEVALREQLQSLSQARADHTVEHFKNLGSVDDMRPETFPQFTPPGEPLVRALESGLPDLALMALMCVLFFMAGFTAFLRMEVQ